MCCSEKARWASSVYLDTALAHTMQQKRRSLVALHVTIITSRRFSDCIDDGVNHNTMIQEVLVMEYDDTRDIGDGVNYNTMIQEVLVIE